MSARQFFCQVDASEFRRRINRDAGKIKRSGYETVIFDSAGDILGIMHAASIDEKGRVHPTQYYLRRMDPPVAGLSLVA
jgi:hypothetical protein